jgi:hypothetical protein
MPIVIREVVSEVVLTGRPRDDAGAGAPAPTGAVDTDDIVRRAAERVLEQLRREWDR